VKVVNDGRKFLCRGRAAVTDGCRRAAGGDRVGVSFSRVQELGNVERIDGISAWNP
jgi:hypothetical protein